MSTNQTRRLSPRELLEKVASAFPQHRVVAQFSDYEDMLDVEIYDKMRRVLARAMGVRVQDFVRPGASNPLPQCLGGA